MAATILREWQHAGDSFQLTERDKKLSAKGRSLRLIAFAAALLDIPEQHLGDGTNALHGFSWAGSLINAIRALDGIGEDDFKAGKRKTTGDWLSATEGESSTDAADPYAKGEALRKKLLSFGGAWVNVNIPETAKKYFVNSAAGAGSSISANPLHGLVETTADKALRQATEKMGSTIVDEQRVGYCAPAVLRRLEKSKSVQDMAELTDTQFEQWLTDSKEGKRMLTPDQHCAITIRLKIADSESLSNVVKVHRLMNSWITNTTNKLLLGSDKSPSSYERIQLNACTQASKRSINAVRYGALGIRIEGSPYWVDMLELHESIAKVQGAHQEPLATETARDKYLENDDECTYVTYQPIVTMSPAAATNLLRELTAIYDAVHGTRNSLLAIHALAKDDIGMGEINRPSVMSALFECEAGALEAMRRQRGGEDLNKNDLPGEIMADATEDGAATARSGRPQLSHNLNRMKETFKEIKSSNDSIRQLAAVQNISVVQVELLKERIRERKGTEWDMHLFKEYVPKMDVRGLL